MKLFVWVDPYRVSYGTSLVFAIAETEDAAREQAANGRYYAFSKYDHNSDGVMKSLSKIELGAPDRVVDLPCAEWHEWSE